MKLGHRSNYSRVELVSPMTIVTPPPRLQLLAASQLHKEVGLSHMTIRTSSKNVLTNHIAKSASAVTQIRLDLHISLAVSEKLLA